MTFIYKLDPRAKLLLVFLFAVVVFIVDSFPVTVVLMLSFLALRLASKIPLRGVGFLKNLTMLVFVLILMQTIFGHGENYILKPLFPLWFPLLGGYGSLKWEGFTAGVATGCRLSALMILMPMLTQTTAPDRIATGLAALGFNYRITFIITTAFNLISVFEEEGRVIMDAQKLRGIHAFEHGSFFAKMKAYPSLAVPLVLGAMRKAQLISISMDSRAFGIYKTRSWLDKPVMKRRDFLSMAVCFAFSALALSLNFLLK